MVFDLEIYKKTWGELQQRKIITPYKNNREAITLEVFDRLDSTNNKAWELIDRNNKILLSAIALSQTAGKGQWGRSWVSAEGGLYLSVAMNLELELKHSFALIMATAWGITTVLRVYDLPVTIKWSNDLILNNCKLGGIKVETRNTGNKIDKAVIGVGINWCNSTPSPGINLQSYYQNKDDKSIKSLEVLTAIASYGIVYGYEHYLAIGIDRLLAEYTAILNSIGKQINLNRNFGEVIGVTTAGKLQVKMRSPGASTIINFAPGEVSLGY